MPAYKGTDQFESSSADDMTFRKNISHHTFTILLIGKEFDLWAKAKVGWIQLLSSFI
jgi:hypothetical protein